MSQRTVPRLTTELDIQRCMADEWMAHLAESGVSQHRSIWNRIVDAIRSMLRDLGFNIEISERDVAMLLYESQLKLEGRKMTPAEIRQLNSVFDTISEGEVGIGEKFRYESAFGRSYAYSKNVVTPEENEAYMKAAEAGDVEKCQEMVDIIAERFGIKKSK